MSFHKCPYCKCPDSAIKKVNSQRESVKRLSPKTGDMSRVVRNYLNSIGHVGWLIGPVEVWVRYEGRKVVGVGPSRESVENV